MSTDSPVVPQDPPPWIARAIGWLVLSIFAAAAAAAVLVEVPQSLEVPFVLVSPTEATLSFEEKALVHARPGRPVRLFFEAFPSERFGTVDGTLGSVAAAANPTADGPVFPAAVRLAKDAVGSEGDRRPLGAGLRGTARIALGHRTLAQMLFDPSR